MAEKGTPEPPADSVSSLSVSANTEDGKREAGGDIKLSDEEKPEQDVDHDEKPTDPDQDNKCNDEEDQPQTEPQDTASNKETDVKTMAPPADGSSTPAICSQTNLPSRLNEAGDRSHGDKCSKENSKKSLEIETLTAENLTSPDVKEDKEDSDLPGEGSEASNARIPEAEGDGKHGVEIERPNETLPSAAQTDVKDEEEPKAYSSKPVSYPKTDDGDKKVTLGDRFGASNDKVPEAEKDGKHEVEIERPNETLPSAAQTDVKDEKEPKAYSSKPVSYPKTDDGDKKVTLGDRFGASNDKVPEAEKDDGDKKVTPVAGFTASDNRIPEPEGGRKPLLIAMGIGVIVLAILLQQLQARSPPQKHSLSQADIFINQMERVKAEFTHQRTELWTRSKIHLLRHLQSAQPAEPISAILTAGVGAQQTLRCLAQSLASAFSSARNASVLFIDGHSKAGQNSDQVKLDIDSQLQGAFEGNKQAAVIHRFEELPPGSTLIFYRYCDHENAAYKKPFLVFTVLLGDQREIPVDAQFSAVEEMVDDHLQEKFLSHSRPVSFDSMDRDKYGGLWSRISHLILPVAAEETIEHKGCERM